MGWGPRWGPVILWAAVISTFSTHLFTADNTSRFIIPILHWLLPYASMATLAELHHLVRKCAHFTEYFILSVLILRGIRAGRPGTRLAWALAAVLAVACYASLDEFHQSFVPGRTPAVGDVMIDTSGGIAAQLTLALLTLLQHKKNGSAEVSTADSA